MATTADLSHEVAVRRSDELSDILKASAEMQTAPRQSIEGHELAQQTLHDIGESFRVVIDNALDAVVAMNASGLITVWNKQAATIFGWCARAASGKATAAQREAVIFVTGKQHFTFAAGQRLAKRRAIVTGRNRLCRNCPKESQQKRQSAVPIGAMKH